jgi:hypothetical protein
MVWLGVVGVEKSVIISGIRGVGETLKVSVDPLHPPVYYNT